MKFMSWNINGVSSVLNNCEYRTTLELFNTDIYAFQETKVTEKDYRMQLLGYHAYWSFHETSKSLYPQSGTLILSKEEAKNHYTTFPNAPDFDTEGRLIVLEFESFFFVNVYVPQSQDEVSARSDRNSLERKQYRARFDRLLREHMEALDGDKPVIICGDFNAAISKIDMAPDSRWQDGEGVAKDTSYQLRQLVKIGFTDTFRHLHPKADGAYTHYWNKDSTKGRRLDYFFVSSDLKNKIVNANIHASIKGSDHLPIILELDMKAIKKRNNKLHHLTYDDLLNREIQGIFFKDLKEVDLSYAWDTYEIENNPLYLHFKNDPYNTVKIRVTDVKTLWGVEFDTEAAKMEEFWIRKPEDPFGQCWHKNGYYFIGFTTKSHTTVMFRKYVYKGTEVKYHVPDIVMNGLLKPRTARKIEEAVNYILEEEGYPIY